MPGDCILVRVLRRINALLTVITLSSLLLSSVSTPPGALAAPLSASPANWISLTDLAWETATTGWRGVSNDQGPDINRAFHGGAMSMAGNTYEKGLGVYPLSEITYLLNGDYDEFAAEIGLDASAQDNAQARFLVFIDDILVYRSRYLTVSDSPQGIDAPIGGGRLLRLVVDSPDDAARGAYADWGNPRLLKSSTTASPDSPELTSALNRRAAQRALGQITDDDLMALGAGTVATLPQGRGRRPASDRPAGQFSPASGRIWLTSAHVAVSVGTREAAHASLTIIDLDSKRPIMWNAGGSVSVAGHRYYLNADTHALGSPPFTLRAVSNPVLGLGTQAELRLQTDDEKWRIDLLVTLYAKDACVYEIVAVNRETGDPADAYQLFTFDDQQPSLSFADGTLYLTDISLLHNGVVHDDGIARHEPVGDGEPVLLWDEAHKSGLLMAMLDDTMGQTYFSIETPAGSAQSRWGLRGGARAEGTAQRGMSSGRLYLEVTRTSDIRRVFDNLRSVIAQQNPAPTLPAWVKYQWLSWYIYGMSNDAEAVQRQADYIATHLGDLGRWNALIDAGWYVSEGREGSDWRTVDEAKFPGGLHSLVARLHEQKIDVVLYLSVPYLDSRVMEGAWLGLSKIIEEHPDWLRLLGDNGERQSYAFDFSKSAVRDYWAQVMDDFFAIYGVDGIKIDGIGNTEGAIISPDEMDRFGLIEGVNDETMDMYRFFMEHVTQHRPDAYVETGWLTPAFARTYAHVFRYGDELPQFSAPYPKPGMVEHIDYAIFQKQALGLRPNMGAIYDDPNTSTVNRWWLEAGLALGTEVTLGFDLAGMTPETLSFYRSLLAQYEPFTGTTTYGQGMWPSTFATTRGDTTYLGVLNRTAVTATIPISLAEHGVNTQRPVTMYDVEAGQVTRRGGAFDVALPPQSFRLYIIRQAPGVMWTNSSFTVTTANRSLSVTLKGPDGLPGYAYVRTARPARVTMDGQPMNDYSYDAVLGVLSLTYMNSVTGHVLSIRN